MIDHPHQIHRWERVVNHGAAFVFLRMRWSGKKKCHTGVIQESWCLLLYHFCITPKLLVYWSFSGLEASPKIGMNSFRSPTEPCSSLRPAIISAWAQTSSKSRTIIFFEVRRITVLLVEFLCTSQTVLA